MISAILFGRNDDHAGNFRHRAVLSINVLAEQLDDTDEIIFVDWNTAETAPTFPEAVAQSLTERARTLLRIIRVGGDIHAEHVRRGVSMPVVPVVAYNTGIRRANPQNKWILITTTDLLLLSRATGRTLSNVAATLRDGAYGLPRFELPRWIWQGLKPTEPTAAIECLSKFGKRLHLEEAIRLPAPELFDAPGDFQLVLRADLIAIDGLDEAMSIGAIGPDSNLLKRLALMGRAPQSLEDQFAGYHCDHTSFPSASHRVGRLENDKKFFFDEVRTADVPFQRSTWGLANRALQEIKLAEGVEAAQAPGMASAEASDAALLAQRLAGVAAAIGGEQTACYDTTPRFNGVGYPTRHVIAFLLDHLFEEMGPVFYVGINERLTSLLAAVLERLEPQRELVCFAPDARASFEQRYSERDAESVRPLLIFDFGIDAGEAPGLTIQRCAETIRRALWDIRECFAWCAKRERELSRGRGRSARIVTINTVNTEFERFVLASLDCSLSPFITRVRGGYVNPEFPPRVPVVSHPAVRHVAERLGRKRGGLHAGEFARAWAIVVGLVRDPPPGRLPRQWLAPSVQALLDWPDLAAALQVPQERIAQIRSGFAAAREKTPIRAPAPWGSDTPAYAKLASAQDWEHSEWYDVAYWYLGDHRSYNAFQRHRGDWEHIHFLFCLARFGILDTDAEVVVLARTRNRFAPMLARRVGKVHLVNVGWQSNSRLLRVPELRLDSSIRVYNGTGDPALSDVRAAALIVQRPNVHPFACSGLWRACRALKRDGIVGISLDVVTRPAKGAARLGQWLNRLPGIDDLANDRGRARALLPSEFKALPAADWNVDPESFELVASANHWRLRQMTAERCGARLTSAIRWFSRRV